METGYPRECPNCHEHLPKSAYQHKGPNRKGGRADGMDSRCKECVNAGRRKSRTCLGCGCTFVHIGKSGSRATSCPDCRTRGKVCFRCNTYKPFDRFYGDPLKKLGAYCKDGCALANNRERMYGIGRSEHDALVEASANGCPICGKPGLRMSLDHDHETGAVRGIICGQCNLALGHVKDSVDTLLGAIAYLKKHSAPGVK